MIFRKGGGAAVAKEMWRRNKQKGKGRGWIDGTNIRVEVANLNFKIHKQLILFKVRIK